MLREAPCQHAYLQNWYKMFLFARRARACWPPQTMSTFPTATPLRLRFTDPVAEQEFLLDHRRDAAREFRWGVLLAALMALLFMWQDNQISVYGYRATNIRTYLILPLCGAVWLALGRARADRFVEPMAGAFLIVYSVLVAAIFMVFEPGFYGLSGAVAEGNFLIILLATFTMAHLRVATAAWTGAGVLAVYLGANYWYSKADFTLFLYGNFSNLVMAYLLGAAACTMLERLRRRQFLNRRDLASEKERYKNLLFALVPSQIAERIEQGELPVADAQAETAILYSDFAGYSQLSGLAPRPHLHLLNELLHEFDVAAERYGVVKVKTIGDGYLAVCGAPVPELRRTVAMARFGLEMVAITRRTAARFNLPISIRVGIHTGTLIAGVIGKDRYSFDMAGASVDMASRMEASAPADRVQVSAAACQRLQGQFDVEPCASGACLLRPPYAGPLPAQ